MAEGFCREMSKTEPGEEIETGSAGLSVFEGQPPSSHSVVVMKQEGIDISGQRSQTLTPQLVQKATHLFGMTSGHREVIEMLFPEAREKVFVLREFIVEDDLDLDVPDPIGMDLEAYERTRNLIKEAMPSILEFVTRPNGGDPLHQNDDDPQHST